MTNDEHPSAQIDLSSCSVMQCHSVRPHALVVMRWCMSAGFLRYALPTCGQCVSAKANTGDM